jgi:hypothetical protein
VNPPPAQRRQAMVLDTLGPPNRLISTSKTGYREANPDHVAVFNANVCVAAGKLWFGDFDLTLDEAQLVRRATRTGEVVYLLYEWDGRFEHENAPLLEEAVYSVTPTGHTRVDHRSVERRRDGRLYERPTVRPPRWRHPNRPHLWRPWQVHRHTERSSHRPDGAQRSSLLYLGRRGLGQRSSLLVLGLHSWSRQSRGVMVECTWYPGGRRLWAPSIAPRLRWRHGRIRPFLSARFTPGVSHELRLGIATGRHDDLWG